MLKSIIALFRIFKLMRSVSKTAGIKTANITIIDNSDSSEAPLRSGAFINKDSNSLIQRSDSVYIEDEGISINIGYICACGLPVFELSGDDGEFGCAHCDSVCMQNECPSCTSLMLLDYGTGEEEVDL